MSVATAESVTEMGQDFNDTNSDQNKNFSLHAANTH
jgi:hypothetical protein